MDIRNIKGAPKYGDIKKYFKQLKKAYQKLTEKLEGKPLTPKQRKEVDKTLAKIEKGLEKIQGFENYKGGKEKSPVGRNLLVELLQDYLELLFYVASDKKKQTANRKK
ncbi:MAG: hypothetical protein ABIH00_04500 [Armatimonadota bacterium]